MNAQDKAIAARAKSAMEKAGVQNNDLSKRVGKSSATVSDYLNGVIRIPVSVLVEISSLTGETIDKLATGIQRTGQPENGYIFAKEQQEAWKINGNPPNDFEQRIIGMLRRLPADQRQAFTDLITTAYFDHMENK